MLKASKSRKMLSSLFSSFMAFVFIWGMSPLAALAANGDASAALPEGSGDSISLNASGDSELAVQDDSMGSDASAGSYAEGEALVVYHASGAAKGSTGLLSIQSDSDPLADAGFAPSEVIDLSVADDSGNAVAAKADGAFSAMSEDGSTLASGSDVRVALVKRDNMTTSDLIAALEALDYVECAQPNYTHELCSVSTNPNDVLYQQGLQWNLNGENGVDYQVALDADAAAGAKAEDNIVAVIDTGVDYTNPDLAGVMWSNPGDIDGCPGAVGTCGYDTYDLDDDPMPGPAGEATHGTHCSGLIAAQTNNGIGVAGTAQHTKIMALKANNDNGDGPVDIACVRAYEYIIAAKLGGQNIVAVSNSWGVGSYSPVLDYVVNQAGKAGVLSLFAAGNDGSDLDTISNGAVTGLQSPYAILVAASKPNNTLASFSNYNVATVDVASPGVRTLSTIRTSDKTGAEEYGYYALIAELTGLKPLYLKDMGSIIKADGTLVDGAKIALMHRGSNGWEQASTEDASHFTYAADTKCGKSVIKCTLSNIAGLSDAANIDKYEVVVAWADTNPFYGTDVDPSACLFANSVIPYSEEQDFALTSYGTVYNQDHSSAMASRGYSYDYVPESNRGAKDGSFGTVDTSSDKLFYQNETRLEGISSGDASFYISTFAVDLKTDTPAYAYMSGTSMATPMLAGCCAELASLYPDDSALELRGRLVGGTETLTSSNDSSGNKKQIASDGRFSFDAAIDDKGSASDSSVNANTWSISCSGNEITVHGYGLGDAKLYVDETTHTTATASTSQTADSITFTAPDALFDGAKHRFDVVDSSTGRTYTASYVVPKSDSTQLVAIGSLPTGVTSTGTATLISATDRLFLADIDGKYMYCCTDPARAASADSWTEVSNPSANLDFMTGDPSTKLRYAYRDGKIYAFYADWDSVSTGSPMAIIAYCLTYDIAENSWSEADRIGSLMLSRKNEDDDYYFFSTSAAASEGAVCFTMTQETTDMGIGNTQSITCFLLEPGSDAFTQLTVPNTLRSLQGVAGFYSKGSNSYFVAITSAAYDVGLSFDGTAMSILGVFAEQPTMTLENSYDQLKLTKTVVGNGIFEIGPTSYEGYGDAALVDPSSCSWNGLGSLLGSETAQITPTSAAMFDGKVYLTGFASDGDGTGTLYALPDAVASKLTTTDATLSAAADSSAGGTAAVSDWRGNDAASLVARRGDVATWTATPKRGYAFKGWYDEKNELVSLSATSDLIVTGDTSLTAQFEASPVVVRLSGDTALDTMKAIVDNGSFKTGGTVVLATLANFPDALTASGIAGLANAPVLLTDGAELSSQTKDELVALKPNTVIVCGGTSAISDGVAASAKTAAGVASLYRCAGASRSGTACEVYKNAKAYAGASFGTTAFIATGATFADALSIAPYAYAKHCPIFLTEGDGAVSAETVKTMKDGGIENFYILGGTGAVSSDVKDALEGAGLVFYGRLSGDTRYETSLAIAQFELASGMNMDNMAVSTGENYKDALSGAAVCGMRNSVLLLAKDSNRIAITGPVKSNRDAIFKAYVLGGTKAVSQDTMDYLVKEVG